MSTKIVEFSDGLRTVLQKYCQYRGWSTVAPQTAENLRLLITRAGSIEETLEGLEFFFTNKYADDWVQAERPDLGLPFLEQNWERWEIFKAESLPRTNYFSQIPHEYRILRLGA